MTDRAAIRYARALFSLAEESDCLDAVQQDMSGLGATLRESPEFAALLGSRLIPPARRQRLLQRAIGGRVEPLTLHLLGILEVRRRLHLLGDICDVFLALHDERTGLLRVKILTAHPLDEAQHRFMIDYLAGRFAKRIAAELEIDPALIGGFKVRVGDHIYDATISAQLERVRQRLIHA